MTTTGLMTGETQRRDKVAFLLEIIAVSLVRQSHLTTDDTRTENKMFPEAGDSVNKVKIKACLIHQDLLYILRPSAYNLKSNQRLKQLLMVKICTLRLIQVI